VGFEVSQLRKINNLAGHGEIKIALQDASGRLLDRKRTTNNRWSLRLKKGSSCATNF